MNGSYALRQGRAPLFNLQNKLKASVWGAATLGVIGLSSYVAVAENTALQQTSQKTVCCPEGASKPSKCSKEFVTREEFEALKAQLDEKVPAGKRHPGSLRLPGTDTDMHFYGMIRGNALYDAGTPGVGANYFYVYANAIPLSGTNEGNERHQVLFSARESRVGFEAFNSTSWGDISGHIEMDFLGYIPDGSNPQVVTNTANARWRLAYFTVGKVLIGQAPTNFFALKEVPKSLDLAMASGIGANRQMQVRYSDHINDAFSWSVSVEGPESEHITQTGLKVFTNKPGSGGTNAINRVPDFVGKIDVSPCEGLNLGTGLVVRQLALKSSAGKQKATGYGLGFNGHLTMNKTTTLMWQLMGGQGIGRYILDAAGHGAFYDSTTQTFKTQKAYGGFVALEHQWTPVLSSTLIGGLTRIQNDSVLKDLTEAQIVATPTATRATAGGINKNMYSVHVNTIWSPFGETLDLGIGYTHGRRQVEDGRKGTSHRLIVSASYKFGTPSHKSSHHHLPDAG